MAKPKTKKEPWDRMDGEPIRSYEAFNIYRRAMANERTLQYVSKRIKHRSSSTVGRWRTAWKWDERSEAWDEYIINEQRKLEHEQALEEVKSMNKRQADESAAFQRALTLPVSALSKIMERRKEDVLRELEDMPIEDLYNLIAKGAQAYTSPSKTERVARGVPSDIGKIEGGTIVIELPEELED